MKSILIGSVSSSKIIFEEMIHCGFPLTYVFGLDESKSKNISGYESLCSLADMHRVPNMRFVNINDESVLNVIKNIDPDFIFVIGLSQIIKKELIDLAKKAVIGCHPAPLPKYRGRAVVVWQMLLGEKESKCTIFKIDEGVDSGDIIDQEPYIIGEDDYAIDVQNNINDAFRKLCKRVLVNILNDNFKLKKQNESYATYCLARREEDGQISWEDTAENIYNLIRAISYPYPGAFSYYDGKYKVYFDKASVLRNELYIGFPGQICKICDEYIDILTRKGILRVEKVRVDSANCKFIVGHKFKEVYNESNGFCSAQR